MNEKRDEQLEKAEAREREREKTQQQRAEDIAYTINHSISCGVTDILVQPAVASLVTAADNKGNLPPWLRWTKNIFEDHSSHGHGHSHGKGHGHHHDHHHHDGHAHTAECAEHHGPGLQYKGKNYSTAHAHPHGPNVPKTTIHAPAVGKSSWLSSFGHNVWHWTTGEVIGDVGAVPLTIWVQRSFPSLMTGIQNIFEPIAGPMFRAGAKHSAKEWGFKNGYTADSDEVKAKAESLYQHEITHLPQAVIWNCFSFPINIGSQMVMYKKTWRDVPLLATAKTFGAFFSNGVLIGGRAWIPDTANKWDTWSGENLVIPATRAVGGLFGIDADTMERVAKRQAEAEGKNWQDKEKAKRLIELADTGIKIGA